MALLSIIRRWHFREEIPIREIERRTGLSRNTIRKYLRSGAVEPKFKIPDRPSNLDPFADRLEAWLRAEASKSRVVLQVSTPEQEPAIRWRKTRPPLLQLDDAGERGQRPVSRAHRRLAGDWPLSLLPHPSPWARWSTFTPPRGPILLRR
jgi:hypothetical protein